MEVETLTWSGIEFVGDDIAVVLSERGHAGALGQVLADEAVGVFVGATFPGVMGRGEIELQTDGVLDCGIAMELGAVVGGDGAEVLGVALGQANGAVVELLCGARLELADQDVTGFALDQADDAVLVAVAHDGVDLPMAELAAPGNRGWAFGEMALAGEPAAAVVGAVALAKAALACTPQMLMQVAAAAPVVPNVAVDGLVADAQALLPTQQSRHLFRAPLLAQ